MNSCGPKKTRPKKPSRHGHGCVALPPSHAMLRGCEACCGCSASGCWPVPLLQARSRVPVRCICCAGMPGFCMIQPWFVRRAVVQCYCLRYALCHWLWRVQLSHSVCCICRRIRLAERSQLFAKYKHMASSPVDEAKYKQWLLLQLMRPHCRRTRIGLCSGTSLPSHSSKLTC